METIINLRKPRFGNAEHARWNVITDIESGTWHNDPVFLTQVRQIIQKNVQN